MIASIDRTHPFLIYLALTKNKQFRAFAGLTAAGTLDIEQAYSFMLDQVAAMWSAREFKLVDGQIVSAPDSDLTLLGTPLDGMAVPLGLCPGGRDDAVKSVELFAGAGGLALGTAEAGLSHKVVIEWDDNACGTLRRNHDDGVKHVRDWEIVQSDVRAYDFNQHCGDVSFVSGGPPCQPFSIGGKHQGQDDNRNMFPQAVRAIREIQPLAFMLENVRGLLRESFSKYFGYIVLQFRYPAITLIGDEEWTDHLARLERLHTAGEKPDLHYNLVYQIVNAVDYGVPQHRWRVFVIGVRSDLAIKYSFPHATHSQDALLHDMWVSGDYWERHRVPKKLRPSPPPTLAKRIDSLRSSMREFMGYAWKTVRDAISDLPQIGVRKNSSTVANHFLNPGAKSYAGHNGSSLDEPAKALKAGDHGVPGGENTLRLENGEVRYFSVRECGRLQCFPDEWKFEGSWTESMRQLGNAVPVKLAEQIARPLVALLRRSRSAIRKS